MTVDVEGSATSALVTAADLRAWLSSGRCQDASGAFCAWRDARSGGLAFRYPEITGYALTSLHSGGLAPEEAVAAKRAADWLVARVGGGDRSARAGWDGGTVYNFDLGMVATGLLTHGRCAGDRRASGVGRALARSLSTQMHADGLPAIDPSGPSTCRSGWSTDGWAHMLKVVQCLLLANEEGEAGTAEAAHALVATAARHQRGDGSFRTQVDDDFVMLHPHLYAAEGLWMYGTAVGDGEAVERSRLATEWALSHQLPSGGLPSSVGADGRLGPEQLDATAQGARLALLHDVASWETSRALARLRARAVIDGVGRALVYQPGGPPHLNAWVTMFAAQALDIAEGAACAHTQLV